ncbi:MAG: prolyl oligopeptidase family serine peptidase [Alphaproteobacteria bacterium]|nr:prolyl oligopeptidase family serine peptidase [Alphaproteobacteria bacterium]
MGGFRLAGLIGALLGGALLGACQPQGAADATGGRELIARAALFGDPARASAAISPDGTLLAFIAPYEGRPNIWTAPIADPAAAAPLTTLAEPGVRRFRWAETSRQVLFFQDQGGDENWRLFAVDVATHETRPLSPEGARATIMNTSGSEPNVALVMINDRDPAWADLYRVDILTGERTLLERNTRRFTRYIADRDNRVRLARRALLNGAAEIWSRSADGAWSPFYEVPLDFGANTEVIGFEEDPMFFLMFDSVNRNTAALVRVNIDTGEREILGQSTSADVTGVWLNPATGQAQAYSFEYLRREWRGLTDAARADLALLDERLTGDARVLSRSNDDRFWIVQEEAPRNPGVTWLYDRSGPRGEELREIFVNRPALSGRQLARMIPLELPARDGLTLVSYLTLPPGADSNDDGRPDQPLPMVVVARDDPWSRESFGFNPVHQWLASRGYAALSVNVRGSPGFGIGFMKAGTRELGGKMQEDLSDAVAWAVAQGVAREDGVAIMGQWFGGYAALAGLAFTPDAYACGVSLAAPADLAEVLTAIPPHWEAYRAELYARIGDPGRDAVLLRQRSPINGAIARPLLIAHGAHDRRVPRAESDRLMQRLSGRNAGFVYLLYPDEGHALRRWQNRLSFYAAAENFLARCLGGPAEPMSDDFVGASAQTMAGGAVISGLRELAPPPPRPAAARANAAPDPAPAPQTAPAAAPDRDAPIATAPRRERDPNR